MYIDNRGEQIYEVGDVVKIIEAPPLTGRVRTGIGDNFLSLVGNMADYCGMRAIIESITPVGNYRITVDRGRYVWCNKFFQNRSAEIMCDEDEDFDSPNVSKMLSEFKVV